LSALHFVCRRDELEPGQMRAVEINSIRVVVCRSGDEFAVLRDICPHQGAQLSGGALSGTNTSCAVGRYQWTRDGKVLRCPRHGYEFDIFTGLSLHDPEHIRVRGYKVVEKDDDVFIEY
jgi:nitrite reductase/ring-hydroxylating ferredoxin subunit